MIRKVLVVLLVLSLMLTAVGCASSAPEAEVADVEEATEVEEVTYKVAMICDSSIADGGWGAACYNAMVAAAEVQGFETQYTDSIESSDFVSSMKSYCDLGFDMIFAPGNQYTDAVKEVAESYPDVKFALLNGTVETDNIASILPDADQIGYMAGALAGLMSNTNSIGFIGGMELDTTKAKLAGYEKAAQFINPDIEVSSAYAGSFSDSAKGKEIAKTMVSTKDVDVMYGDASAVDSGAREALAEYEDRYDIGQPADLVKLQPDSTVLIGSVVTDNARMIELCMEDLKNGTYGNKTVYGNLENGALSVGTFSDKVPQEVIDEYLKIVEEIEAGTFMQ